MTDPGPRERWNGRYASADGYLYGTRPNDFLVQSVEDLPPGDVLCLADGEGRNGVFLAGLGHRVTTVDISQAGVDKAARLALDRGVEMTTIVADLAYYDLGREKWDLIVSIFAHTPPSTRARLHGNIATALRPDGRFVLEAYTADQIGRGTGGPPTPDLTMSLPELRTELTDLTFAWEIETVRDVTEGAGHTGEGAVVQVIARR